MLITFQINREASLGLAHRIALILTDFTERIGINSTHLLGELAILSNFLKISSIRGYHLPF
jgi:hypothetical protein